MRAKEFILKEDILNEADWNKVKSAILGGVLSLSALGAPNLQAKDIASMSGEEIKQYVIQNSQVKNKQEILDVINMLGQDRKREQPPIATPTATPVAKPAPVATPPATPTATPVAKPAPVATPPATPTATPVAKPAPVATPPATPTATPTSTDIKGLNWNMSGPEVSAKLEELGISSWNQSSSLKTNPNGISNIEGGNLTYGGINFGQSNGQVSLLDGKLASIYCVLDPSEFNEAVKVYATKFGSPKIETDQVQNKAGTKFDRTTAIFKTADTIVTIRTTGGLGRIDRGSIEIRSSASLVAHAHRDAAEVEKKSKDF
jgi:hypothetical protein